MIPWKFKNTEEYLHTTTDLSVSITFGYEFLEILKFIYPFCFHDNQGHICSTDSFYPHLFRANIGIITVKCYENGFNSNRAGTTHVFVCPFDGLQWQQRSFWAFQNLHAHIRNVSKFHTIRVLETILIIIRRNPINTLSFSIVLGELIIISYILAISILLVYSPGSLNVIKI